MRPLDYSLRTAILVQLVFLIVAAMLLINVVMMKFAERDLIRAKARTGKLLVYALEQSLSTLPAAGSGDLKELAGGGSLRGDISRLVDAGGYSELSIVDGKGHPVFPPSSSTGWGQDGLRAAREAAEKRLWRTRLTGRTWGVIWFGSEWIWISAPLRYKGRSLGGVCVGASLVPVYETLRESEKIFLLYILLDTLILAIVGIVLLSRIVVKPLGRLLKMTEEYREGDLGALAGEISRNEIGALFRSMNSMLRRLDQNKGELRAHIRTLEETNLKLQSTQNELIRSEKQASVGRLAAGIAHEIGNPIGIVLGYLELLKKGDVTEEDKGDFLGRVELEITRIHQIIRNLLDFSRPSTGRPEDIRVHDVLNNTVGMLKPQPMMEGVEVGWESMATDDLVTADPNRLQQVFLNITMNAMDALAERKAREGEGYEKRFTIKTCNRNGAIEIRFADNGSGIAREELGRIFDPFYTTKEPGKGTGLGLSVCYRIIEGMGGTLEAESTLDQGTTMIVSLPLRDPEKGGGE
ncbi:MAG: HAMP domain-containing histidine kinase [Deltaproteobacteria bacterium]|nr:HAMP domain-containing histidine kinase [Deltaproteobacteria bacterium]